MIQKEDFIEKGGRDMAEAEAPVRFFFSDDMAAHRQLILEQGAGAVSFPAGAVLSRAAEIPARVYYLLEGMVKVYTVNGEGFIRLLGYHTGGSICVLDGLRGASPSVVTVEAITPVQAVPLTNEDLCRLGERSPRFALDLAYLVGDTLRLMCYDAANQTIRDVQTRLARFLCLYAGSDLYRRSRCVEMTQENLASAVNASRIQVARVCSRLQKRGVLRTRRGRVYLLDAVALERLADRGEG